MVCPYYISTGMFSGVSSKIIPILEPDFVATSVVDATLANKEIVLLPWWTTYLFMLKVGVSCPVDTRAIIGGGHRIWVTSRIFDCM